MYVYHIRVYILAHLLHAELKYNKLRVQQYCFCWNYTAASVWCHLVHVLM